MMSYVKKILRIFHGYFHNLKIFNTKFIKKIQFCMKNIYEKIIIYFSSIGIIYYKLYCKI
jgi:hypothetical protein